MEDFERESSRKCPTRHENCKNYLSFIVIFQDLDNLDILDLSNNEIEDFEGNFSSVLENLDSLFLDGNDIQSLPSDMEVLFSRLQNLTLHDNPLHCNCEVRMMR